MHGNGSHSGADAMEIFRSLLLLCAAVVCIALVGTKALAYTDFGQGRPIAAKDLAGKKFCWNAGVGLFTPPTGITRTAKAITLTGPSRSRALSQLGRGAGSSRF